MPVIYSLLGLALTGLGFVTYKHPDIAIKIIKYAATFISGIFLLYALITNANVDGMNTSMSLVQDVGRQNITFNNLYESQNSFLTADTLSEKLKGIDKTMNIMQQQIIQMRILDSVNVSITSVRDGVVKQKREWQSLFFLIIGILVSLYFIANMFDKSRQPKNNENDSPAKQPNRKNHLPSNREHQIS